MSKLRFNEECHDYELTLSAREVCRVLTWLEDLQANMRKAARAYIARSERKEKPSKVVLDSIARYREQVEIMDKIVELGKMARRGV